MNTENPSRVCHGPATQTAPEIPASRTAPADQRPVVVTLADAQARVGGRLIWSGVNLRIHAGEFVAVLGPNGAGKSTLLTMLLGLHSPAGGRVSVFGAPTRRGNKRIGYLPQRRAFDTQTRVRGIDIVRLGLDGDRWGTPIPLLGRLLWPAAHRRARERLTEVIDLVGAAGYAHRPIGECSGGEQQRLLIAQALIRRPDLLLLDEPLDSLDVPSQASVSALIQHVCRTQRVAVVLVAHDINPILPYLDQVIYLAQGGAVIGLPERVITAEALSQLYGTPIEVLRDRTGRLVVVGAPGTRGH